MGHVLDYYKSPLHFFIMALNRKHYEYKADLASIDLITNAGYNPIAAIIALNKISGEALFDFGVFTTHPKSSKRLMEMYKYIYVKYPWALKTTMTKNPYYQNFLYSSDKEIKKFKQKQKEKSLKEVEL